MQPLIISQRYCPVGVYEVHKALIYDYADEIELAEVFYDQSLSIQRDLYVLRLYYNFLHRNNLTKKRGKYILYLM